MEACYENNKRLGRNLCTKQKEFTLFVFDTEKDKFIETSVYFETRDAKYLSYDYNRFVFQYRKKLQVYVF